MPFQHRLGPDLDFERFVLVCVISTEWPYTGIRGVFNLTLSGNDTTLDVKRAFTVIREQLTRYIGAADSPVGILNGVFVAETLSLTSWVLATC